jgi:glycerol-3-phosphate dehydrogenase (NAD(P)+)
MSETIGIIGAGGWGIALAKLLSEKRREVTLWCHGVESYRELSETRQSRSYLPDITLPAAVRVTRSIEEAARDKTLLLCAVPSHAVRDVMSQAAHDLRSSSVLVCASKGLEEESLKTMGEVLTEIIGASSTDRQAFLSGPTFALEVARGLPAAVTVAASSEQVARDIQEVLSTENLRVYTSQDITGVQMGGVIKNIIAIAAGISDGLGLGHNARAALMTRGLAEMTRLAVCMGADPLTLAGLPGVGDLILTCTGALSRNRQVGLSIAAGKTVEEITGGSPMVAEGIRNARTVYRLASRLGVEMPIVEQMYRVIYEGKKPADGVRDLMLRSLKAERC